MFEDGKVTNPVIIDGETMDGNLYLWCLNEVLIPFITANYDLDNIMFWPDMASCHYRSDITEYSDLIWLKYVTKAENARNCPQVRPLELFWAICKDAYKKKGMVPKGLVSFSRIWRNISFKVAEKSGKVLMTGLRRKIKEIGETAFILFVISRAGH